MFKKIKRYWYNFAHPIIGEVWELHRVTSSRCQDKRYAPYDITPQRLESLIEDYQKKGYRFISIDEMAQRIQTYTTWRKALTASKCIAITLDDGYRDNYEVAYPIFKKHCVPFCIYVSTGYIDGIFGDRDDHPLALTTQQLYDLDEESLCTIGAHTVTHTNLCQLCDDDMKSEIDGSINDLQRILGHPIAHFAVPFGGNNEKITNNLKLVGIKSNVNAWGGAIHIGVDVYNIPRFIIEENNSSK